MAEIADLPGEDHREITFPCIPAEQPVGTIFIGVIPWSALKQITYFDVRRIVREKRDIETYLGVQRPLTNRRVEELKQYVKTKDASFPTGIIIAVDAECAQFNEGAGAMTLSNNMDAEPSERVFFRAIARVIDGQHRIAGLEDFEGDAFDLPVIILVGMDLADQAHIFGTVNLAQTRVNPSLAYDLFDLAHARSPQKNLP